MNPNNFSLEYAKDETNASVGAWYPVSGMPVFPFSFGSLLDERLDEAYVTIVRDSKPIYESNTLFRVGFHKNVSEEDEKTYAYYICASDNAHEMPIGSGKYTHKLYLIEATKRLEGIMCQSLTFTNTGGTDYAQGKYVTPYYEIVEDKSYGYYRWFENLEGVRAPLLYESPVEFSSVTQTSMSAEQVFVALYNKKYNTLHTSISSINDAESIVGKSVSYVIETTTAEQTSIEVPVDGNQVMVKTKDAVSYNYKKPDGGDALSQQGYEGRFVIRHVIYMSRSEIIASGTSNTYRNSYATIYATVPIYPFEKKPAPLPYTMKDCVDRVLDLADPVFADGAEQNTTPRYKLDPAQEEWLEGITAPPFTMTQCTLREQLRVIGGYIHAEPRLMFNEEARTDENGNVYDAKKFYVHFDKFNSGASTALTGTTPYIGRTFGQDINQYCTKIETSASNLVNSLSFAKGVIAEPNQHQVKTLRTETVNVRIDETNGVISTTYPIYEIEKVEFMGFDPNGGTFYGLTDITPYVYEKTEYDANLASFGGGYPYSKSFALYYTYGQKDIKGLFFKPQTEGSAALGSEYLTYYSIVNILSAVGSEQQSDVRDQITNGLGGYPALCFRVTYVPVYSARFSQEKPYYDPDAHKTDYMQVYNQSENVIDSKYYGENVKGVAARLGNVEQERTYIFDSLADLPRAGDAYKDATGSYVISAVNTEYKPFYIKTTVALSRGFNRLSQYIGVNSTKRVYEVSEREAYRRSVHLKEFVLIGNPPTEMQRGYHRIFNDVDSLLSVFDPNIIRDKISAVNACGFAKGGVDAWAKAINPVTLPVVSSAFGNSMLFSWSYKDNYSAGEQASFEQSGSVSGFYQKDVPYGDFYGRLYWYYFYLFEGRADLQTRESAFELPQSVVVSPTSFDNRVGTFYSMPNSPHTPNPLLLQKDSREALDFSFAVEFVSNRKDIRIGSALAQCCCLVSGKDNHSKDQSGEPEALELVMLDDPLSEFDNFVVGDNLSYGGSISAERGGGGANVTLTLSNITSRHWAMITPIKKEYVTRTLDDGTTASVELKTGGEVVLASTVNWSGINSATIYITPVKNLY